MEAKLKPQSDRFSVSSTGVSDNQQGRAPALRVSDMRPGSGEKADSGSNLESETPFGTQGKIVLLIAPSLDI